MRIALVVHQFPPERVGGTEVHTLVLARELATRGHAVSVFYPHPGLAEDRVVERDGLRLWQAANPPLRPSASPASQFWRTFRNRKVEASFQRFLAGFRPDLVHFQHVQNVSARLITLAAGRPRLLTLHDYWYFCANGQLLRPDGSLCQGPGIACGACALARLPRPLPPLMRPAAALPLLARNAYLRRALGKIDLFIAPSDYVRERYTGWGLPSERIIVLPHGVSPDRLRGARRGGHDRPGAPLFGYLGAIAPAKGVHVLVEALGALPVEARLVIYGDETVFPEYAARLRRAATHPGVCLAGPLDYDMVGEALAQLDYLIVPSVWHETLCMVVDEAHTVGVPVIASRLGALTRIQDGVNGRLFEAGNVAELAEILRDLCAQPESRDSYASRLPRIPTVAEQTDKLLKHYTKLTGRT